LYHIALLAAMVVICYQPFRNFGRSVAIGRARTGELGLAAGDRAGVGIFRGRPGRDLPAGDDRWNA